MLTDKFKLTVLVFILVVSGCKNTPLIPQTLTASRESGNQKGISDNDIKTVDTGLASERPINATKDQLQVVSASPTETNQSPCDANKWAIVPTQIVFSPGSVGFKLIDITLAIENNSPYWGQINTASGDPIRQSYLSTEGGFIYPAAKQVEIETNFTYAGQVNHWWEVSSQLYTQSLNSLPPGFAMRGEIMISFESIENGYGSPNTWSQAVFQVADHQYQYKMTIPSLTVSCIHQDGQKYDETIGPIHINIDENIRQPSYPTSRPDSEFPSITRSITISGQGMLEFQGINYQTGMAGFRYLVIDLKYTKTNPSLDATPYSKVILLGNDGLTRRLTYVYGPPGCSSEDSFNVDPGQPTNVKLCYLAGKQATSFKLLWVDIEKGIYQVYDLPDGF